MNADVWTSFHRFLWAFFGHQMGRAKRLTYNMNIYELRCIFIYCEDFDPFYQVSPARKNSRLLQSAGGWSHQRLAKEARKRCALHRDTWMEWVSSLESVEIDMIDMIDMILIPGFTS